jgi:FMN phosphatase YigB (HAD superfamily)
MIIIVDIDNTLCNNKKRYELSTNSDGSINWDSLYDYDNVLLDTPNLPMIDLVNRYAKDYKIVIFTSRPESIRNSTEHWLSNFEVQYNELYMRSYEEHTLKDYILKEKMYNMFIEDDVFCAFDDNQNIIDLWTRLGIPSFKVFTI